MTTDQTPPADLVLNEADIRLLMEGGMIRGSVVTDMGGSREAFTVRYAPPAAPDTHTRPTDALSAWVKNEWAVSVYRDPSDLNNFLVNGAFRDFERGFDAGAAALREARDQVERADAAVEEVVSRLMRVDYTLTSLKGWLRHNGHMEQIEWIERALAAAPAPSLPTLEQEG